MLLTSDVDNFCCKKKVLAGNKPGVRLRLEKLGAGIYHKKKSIDNIYNRYYIKK
jgi:hypothetical protein